MPQSQNGVIHYLCFPINTSQRQTQQLHIVKTSHEDHFTETNRRNMKYSAHAAVVPNVLSSLI